MQQEVWFGKYRIHGLLGKGGTAKVYLAEHIKLNSYRAIKCISKTHPLYDLQRNEALILKNLKHSCIPIIYDIEEDEDGSYIVEQYIEGETLASYIETKGVLPEDTIIQYGIQICDLIHYLHTVDRPVLYVDIKPENIIICGSCLKLIDFGSAIFYDELSENRNYLGTRGYAAPELYSRKVIDERCDVYGIGMLLYYMCTGHAIKSGTSGIDNIDFSGRCKQQLKNVINRCLKYNPSQRYASVIVLSTQLSAILRKSHIQSNPSQTITIAVAGAQPRIGVTHFSFRLCNYIIRQRLTCLYWEENNSGCVRSIKSCYEDAVFKKGIFEMEGLPMLAQDAANKEGKSFYRVIVQDFGRLTREKLPEFMAAKVKLLVMGAKDWELSYAGQAIEMVAEYKDIMYLFNFTSGRQFQRVLKNMGGRSCYRIPYEPDPFTGIISASEAEFFQQILDPMKKRSLKERAAALLMKGKASHEAQTDTI